MFRKNSSCLVQNYNPMAQIGEPENLVPEGFWARFIKTEGFWEEKNDKT